jgi:uncharacterized membrane protein YciS (DUF1049 family)
MEKNMSLDLFIFFSVGIFLGCIVKGMIVTKINFFKEDAFFILIPFMFSFVPTMFILSGLDAYGLDALRITLVAWFFAFGFCFGLILCNFSQRRRGLIVE